MKYDRTGRQDIDPKLKCDAAVACLTEVRDSIPREAPDEELLARLTRMHAVQAQGTKRATPKLHWPLWFGLALLSSGAAVAAGGGLEWLRGWWVSIEADGQPVHEALLEDGTQAVTFDMQDGGSASVRVQSTALTVDGVEGAGERLRIQLTQDGPGGQEIEESDDFFGASAPQPVDPGVVSAARHIHTGLDQDGREAHLFLVNRKSAGLAPAEDELDPERGALLVVLREDGDAPEAAIVASLPNWTLRSEMTIEVTPFDRGGALFRFGISDALETLWLWGNKDSQGQRPGASLETQDGRVRVRVDGSTQRIKR